MNEAQIKEIRERREKAEAIISALDHGDRQWVMSIPAQPLYDPLRSPRAPDRKEVAQSQIL